VAEGGAVLGAEEYEFVGGEFAVVADTRKDQPKDGVEPVDDGQDGEVVIEEDVVAAEVGAFVQEDEAEFVGAEGGGEGGGKEDAGAEEADEGGTGDAVGDQERERATDAESGTCGVKRSDHGRIGDASGGAKDAAKRQRRED